MNDTANEQGNTQHQHNPSVPGIVYRLFDVICVQSTSYAAGNEHTFSSNLTSRARFPTVYPARSKRHSFWVRNGRYSDSRWMDEFPSDSVNARFCGLSVTEIGPKSGILHVLGWN